MRTAVKLLKLFCAFATFLVPTSSFAQYIRTDLVSNTGTVPNPADLDPVNGWGLVSTATSPFWVSDNGTGKSTLYAVSHPPQGPTTGRLISNIPVGVPCPVPVTAGIVTDPITHKSGELFSSSRHWMAQSAAGILELVQAALRPRLPWIDRTSVLLTPVWLLPAAEARISYTLPMTAQIEESICPSTVRCG